MIALILALLCPPTPISVAPAPGVDVVVFDSGDVVIWSDSLQPPPMAYPGAPSYQLETCEYGYLVTPSDTPNAATFPCPFKRLYIGGAGNVTIVDGGGNVVTFTAVPVGTQLDICGSRVNATGTTATNIVAMV